MSQSNDHQDSTDESTEWAESRTDWAEDRTIMANERTQASWIRTGLACVAIALGLQAVFRAFEPTYAAKSVASVFLFAALVMFWTSRNRAVKTQKRLDSQSFSEQPPKYFTYFAVILSIATLLTGVVLWLL